MSRAIEREMRGRRVPAEKVAYIPHGVDTRRFRPRGRRSEKASLRREPRLCRRRPSSSSTRAGCCAARGSRRCWRRSRAWRRATRGALLVLVGSGAGQALSVEDELRARVAGGAAWPDASRSPAAWTTSRLACGASDVFAFPSEFEALGLSLVEAAACGLPCVGSRTGGIVDVHRGRPHGAARAARDVAALAAALCARCWRDPDRAPALGAGARARRVRAIRRARRAWTATARLFLELAARRGGSSR